MHITKDSQSPPLTIKQALAQAVLELKHGSDPRLDAQWLLLKILNQKEVSWLIAHGDNQIDDDKLELFLQLVARRTRGEPLAYLLKEWEFYGRKFVVNEAVLVPRPSTERLVDEALDYIKKLVTRRHQTQVIIPLLIADIGTGSGCIAITIGLEIEKWMKAEGLKVDWRIIATDVSAAALKVARQNAKLFDVTDRIDLVPGDILQPIRDKKIDLIVSNLPYVPSAELDSPELLDSDKAGLRFEPRLALDGGEDGLVFIQQLLKSDLPIIYETVGGKVNNKNLV